MQPRTIPVAPYSRVLPPTREPGIWAASPPRATLPETPSILGVVIPLPPDAASDEDKAPARQCAADMDALARAALHGHLVAQKTIPCLAARLHLRCLDVALQRAGGNPDFGRPAAPLGQIDSIKAALAATNRMVANECGKVPLVPDVEVPYQIVLNYRSQP